MVGEAKVLQAIHAGTEPARERKEMEESKWRGHNRYATQVNKRNNARPTFVIVGHLWWERYVHP